MITWSDIQKKRLIELDAPANDLETTFSDSKNRDLTFHDLEKKLTQHAREKLSVLRDLHRRPSLCRLESNLIDTLTSHAFVQVTTPIIMSKGLLAKMGITETHPLSSQVYWLDGNKCLRPMLAPHLYFLLKDLLRLWEKPVRIFEVGPCFRKESQGAHHSTEFTMLNLVEMGFPDQPVETKQKRLEEMAQWILHASGIETFNLEIQDSAVYGKTIDVVAGENNIEVGSGAIGPHPLDIPWRINEAWIGIGFGLERLLMIREKSGNLAKMGRSLSYLDGIRLNL